MPEAGIPAYRDIKQAAADENSVIWLIGTEIVDGYGKCFRAAYYTEDQSVIVGIVNTINPD